MIGLLIVVISHAVTSLFLHLITVERQLFFPYGAGAYDYD